MKVNTPGKAKRKTSEDAAWWVRPDDAMETEDDKAHEKLSARIKAIVDSQDAMRRSWLVSAAMYGGSGNVNGMIALGGGRTMSTAIGPRAESGLSLNVTRNVIDAATAKVASKSRPHLSYVTEGGDYERQHNAEQLELGVAGVFYKVDAYQQMTRAFRDAGVFGSGPVRVYADQDAREVAFERMLPGQLVVDEEHDTYQGEPRSYYALTPVDKYVLAHLYGGDEDKARKILALSDDRQDYSNYGFAGHGLALTVYEGWHRPSGRGANDGRYVKAVGGCTLVDEPWDGGRRGRPPIAVMRWSEPCCGYYGVGIAEQGRGIQTEINALVRQIQNGHHLITGRWLVEAGSKVVSAHIQNDLSSILRYAGTRPEYVTPSIIAPEMYQHLWQLVGKYYELAGINQQSAQAQKPAGLDSGEAQRVYADQQTETLLEKGQRFEDFVKECGQLVTDAAKELAEHGSYEVRSDSADAFETIDWRELDDPDGYMCRVAPTSGLPGTPSGKIDLAYDLMKLGDFDTADVMEIIGMPDMLQKTRLKLASRKLVEKKVALMLRKGEAWSPPPTINLAEAMAIARDMCNLAESHDVDDARLQLVRDFIVACVNEQKLATPPAPPPMMAPGQPGMMAAGAPGMPMPGGPPPGPPPGAPLPA